MEPENTPQPQNTPPQEHSVSPPAQTSTPPETTEKSFGPLIGVIIVVLLLGFGALYFFLYENPFGAQTILPTPEEIREQDDTVVEELETQSTSDEISAIEGDLDDTLLDDLDADLENIEAEFAL